MRKNSLSFALLMALLTPAISAFAQTGNCTLQVDILDIYATDNGTPTDPSDDLAFADIQVTGSSHSCGWIANDPLNSSGAFGEIVTLGPYPIINGDLDFEISEAIDPSCTVQTQIAVSNIDPPFCLLNGEILSISCDPNGTLYDQDDDTFFFDLLVTGLDVTESWVLSENGMVIGSSSFDVPITFGPFLIADGTRSFQITSPTNPDCLLGIVVSPPSPCAAQRALSIDQVTGMEGAPTCVPIRANGMEGLQELQFSVSWDPAVATYAQINDPGILPQGWIIDDSELAQSRVGFVATGAPFSPINIPDSTIVLEICFDYISACTDVVATGSPVDNLVNLNGAYPELIIENGGINEDFPIPVPSPGWAVCEGESIVLDAGVAPGPEYIFEWSFDGALLCQCLTPIIQPLEDGIATLQIINTITGCSTSYHFSIEVLALPQVENITTTNVSCDGSQPGQAVIEVSGNGPFLVSGEPTPIDGVPIAAVTLDGLDIGTYSIDIVDVNGCFTTAFFTILQEELSVEVVDYTPASCMDSNGSIDIEVAGGSGDYVYIWNNGMSSEDIAFIPADTYSVTVIDNQLNCQEELSFDLPNALIKSITLDTTICTNDCFQLQLDAPNAISFQWSSSVTPLSCDTCARPFLLETFQADTYSVTVTGSDGCEEVASVFVDVRSYLDFGLLPFSNSPVCEGDTLEFYSNIFNGQSYNWTGPGNFQRNESDPIIPNANAANSGTYMLNAVDDIGCEVSASTDVVVSSSIELNINLTIDNCGVDCQAMVELAPLGGTPPYLFEFNGGPPTTQSIFDDLCQGDYFVVVTDANGCTSTVDFFVPLEGGLQLSIDQVEPSNCMTFDGSIFVAFSGGTPPYTYSWAHAPGLNTDFVTDLGPGIYELTVTDLAGCIAIEQFVVEATPIVTISPDQTICFGETVQLEVTADDLAAVNWTPTTGLNNSTIPNPVAMPLTTTTYTATVIDLGGCEKQVSTTIFVDPPACQASFPGLVAIGQTQQWCDPTLGPIPFEVTQILDGPLQGLIDVTLGPTPECLSYTGLEAGVDTVFFEMCSSLDPSVCFTIVLEVTVLEHEVWPGDTNDDGVADNFDLLPIGLAVDSTGPVRPNASLSWVGQPAPSWSQTTPSTNTNYAFIDTDGNGLIHPDDTLAITLNWGEEHNLTDNYEEDRTFDAEGIPFYVEPDTLYEGQTISIPVIFGTENDPADDVYGLAFTIEYDPDIVTPGSAFLDLGPSWLGQLNSNMIAIQRDFPGQGQLRVGLTRIDGQNQSGFGTFGHFIITIEDDILLWDDTETENRTTDLTAAFQIANVQVIDFQEEEKLVDNQPTQADVVSSVSSAQLERWVQLFPNPTKNLVRLSSENLRLEYLMIKTLDGQTVFETQSLGASVDVSTTDWAPGLYLVQLHTDLGVVNKRMVVIK